MPGPEIAVVGGGVAGLIAALEVAAGGGRAVVFEGAAEPGGRARSHIVDGCCLNQGPHALYLAGAFHAALQAFGVPVTGGGPDLPNGLGLWDSVPHPLPIRRVGRVDPLEASDSEALKAFFGQLAAEPDLGRGASLAAILAPLPPRARAVVEALIRLSTYVHAPGELDAGAALDQLRLSFAGTVYVDGGWQALVDGLRGAALARDVEIRCGTRVMRVRSAEGACTVHLRGGETQAFAAVVLAVPPKHASAIADESAALGAAARATAPVRAMTLDLALAALPTAGADFVLGMDAPTYLSVHSAVSRLAPSDADVMHLARYLGPEDAAAPELFEDLHGIADALQPGWRERLRHEQRLSGAVVTYDYPRPGHRRASPILPDAARIFLAGDWVGDEGLLADAAAASARRAAAAALSAARHEPPAASEPGSFPGLRASGRTPRE